MRGNTTPFVKLLEDFFRQRSTRSLADTNESNLRIAIELLWFGETQCLMEVHLIVDPAKRHGDGRSGFVDILVNNSQRQHDTSNSIPVIELKNVSLLYLWKARQQNPTANSAGAPIYLYPKGIKWTPLAVLRRAGKNHVKPTDNCDVKDIGMKHGAIEGLLERGG
jgi:hypothetical protein